MITSLFIKPAEIKRRTSIEANIDDDKLTEMILLAQDRNLQNVIGTSLYRKLDALIKSGDILLPENAKYKTLLTDYIMNVVCWYTLDAYLPWAMFSISNSGIHKGTQDNAEAITLQELRVLQSQALENAEFYVRRLVDYLCDYSYDFPEYLVQDNTSDMHPDKDSGYGGWVF